MSFVLETFNGISGGPGAQAQNGDTYQVGPSEPASTSVGNDLKRNVTDRSGSDQPNQIRLTGRGKSSNETLLVTLEQHGYINQHEVIRALTALDHHGKYTVTLGNPNAPNTPGEAIKSGVGNLVGSIYQGFRSIVYAGADYSTRKISGEETAAYLPAFALGAKSESTYLKSPGDLIQDWYYDQWAAYTEPHEEYLAAIEGRAVFRPYAVLETVTNRERLKEQANALNPVAAAAGQQSAPAIDFGVDVVLSVVDGYIVVKSASGASVLRQANRLDGGWDYGRLAVRNSSANAKDFGEVLGNFAKSSANPIHWSPDTAARIDYASGFADDLVNFNPGHRHFAGTLDEDLVLVQYHRADRALGQGRSAKWWTTPSQANALATLGEVQDVLALPPGWGPRNAVSVARIPARTKIEYFLGTARKQTENGVIFRGEGIQFRFKDFDPSWILETRVIPGEH